MALQAVAESGRVPACLVLVHMVVFPDHRLRMVILLAPGWE